MAYATDLPKVIRLHCFEKLRWMWAVDFRMTVHTYHLTGLTDGRETVTGQMFAAHNHPPGLSSVRNVPNNTVP